MSSDQFIDQVARSARLFQRGLITDREFVNVTLNDLRRLEPSEMGSDA